MIGAARQRRRGGVEVLAARADVGRVHTTHGDHALRRAQDQGPPRMQRVMKDRQLALLGRLDDIVRNWYGIEANRVFIDKLRRAGVDFEPS